MEKEEKEVVVMRINKELKKRLDGLAKKRDATLTSLTNDAITKFLDSEEYNFQDLLEIINTMPSLKASVEKISQEMKGCPSFVCKQIIDIIKGKQVFLYEEDFNSIQQRLEKIDQKNLEGVFLHLTIKGNEINKINETLKKANEILNKIKPKIGVGAKSNDHEKVLLFLAYNKKEGDGDDKK